MSVFLFPHIEKLFLLSVRRAAVVSIMPVLQVAAAAGHEPPVVGVGGHSVEVPRVAVPVPARLQTRLSPVAVHNVRLLLLLPFVADVLMVAGDVVGVVLWQAVRSVQVVRSREGGQGGCLCALGRGVGQLVRLLRRFVCSRRGRTLSHPPEQRFARASLKIERMWLAHLQVTTMTMRTSVRRSPPMAAATMIRRGRPSANEWLAKVSIFEEREKKYRSV